MEKPDHVEGPIETSRWMVGQAWVDLKSVYYANTPVWRWLKSGALVFLGLLLWTGANLLLSIRPAWTFLYLVMAYGFLLVLWGPLTHFGIVPIALRLRRTAKHPIIRTLSRHVGKINLTIFFILVVILAVVQPGVMLLEFSPQIDGDGVEVRGDVSCERVGDVVSCHVENSAGFDHVVVLADDQILDRANEEPYEVQFDREAIEGDNFRILFRDAEENTLRSVIRTVPPD